MSVPSARKKRLAAAVGLALAAGLGYAAWVLGHRAGRAMPVPYVDGLYCPGCGVTRCISALLQGNWQAALRSNAAIVVLAPFFVWLGWAAARSYLACGSIRLAKRQNAAVYVAIAALVAFGIVRNLPAFWFLRPPA